MAPATWVRQGKPPHPRDTARGSPGPTATACAMAGCGEEMEALASGIHPPQPGRTRGCPGLYLWSAGIGGQSSRGSSSTSPGRSAVTSRPRVRLQPVSSYSRSRAPCHHTTPHHAGPGAAVPPRSSTLWDYGASPGTSWLWQHLSAHPLPCLQFCVIVHPLSNTFEQVKKPSHSSCHSNHSSRDAGSMGISWTLPAMRQ